MSPIAPADRFDLRSDVRSDVPGMVLVALDGSPFAESALAHARPLARALGSGLHLVTVLDPARTGATSRTSAEGRLQRLEAVAALERVAEALRSEGHRCTFEVREGQPSTEIEASVMERRVGTVALAVRPRSAKERLTPGSVTQGVLNSGAAALLIARGKERRAARPRGPLEACYGRIAVAVDGSSASHRALRLASFLACRDGAEIVLVHVLATSTPHSPPTHDASTSELVRGIPFREASEALRYLRVVERKVSLHGVPVRSRLFYSWSEADAVQADADLLVVAAGGDALHARGYGRGTQRLLLHARIPVLVWRDQSAAATPAEPWSPGRAARAMRRAPARRSRME